MNIAFYTGASGLRAYQQDMDTISNNISNVNTVGYKSARSVFSDLLYSRMDVNTEENFFTGHGVKVSSNDLMFRQGAVIQSGMEHDYAIVGSGFFAVRAEGDGEDQIMYTRNGVFGIGLDEDGEAYLTTSDGYYVLDAEGERIEMSDSGNTATEPLADRIGVFQFSNPFGLQQISGTRFLPTANSGEAQAPEDLDEGSAPYRVVQGALEQSSVELADEMVMVMTTQKAFQFSARLVQTADQLEEIINNLR